MLTISQQITDSGSEIGVWPPKTRSGKRKIDLDGTTLGFLLMHKLRQDEERRLVGPGWSNGVLPDQFGKPVELTGLMFTQPDGRYLRPRDVTRRMQQIARQAGLCTTVRAAAEPGVVEVVAGKRYGDPVGTWTVYRDREPIGKITVATARGLSGTRASLQLAEGIDITLVSKRLGHSSPAIIGNLYVHLLRSSGQRAGEAVAVPRATRVLTAIIGRW